MPVGKAKHNSVKLLNCDWFIFRFHGLVHRALKELFLFINSQCQRSIFPLYRVSLTPSFSFCSSSMSLSAVYEFSASLTCYSTFEDTDIGVYVYAQLTFLHHQKTAPGSRGSERYTS